MNQTVLKILRATLLLPVLFGLYLLWSLSGRNITVRSHDATPPQMIDVGMNRMRGNMVAMQPHLSQWDYTSAQQLSAVLDRFLAHANAKNWLNENTVVVFPEYIGSWLVLSDEKLSVFEGSKREAAMTTMALSNVFTFARSRITAPKSVTDKDIYALFRMKGESMAAAYNSVFGALARKYAVTVVAGSIVLPSPYVENGIVRSNPGPLYNVTAVFGADGHSYAALSKKVHLVPEELGFTERGANAELPIFETPAGRLGVLICADAWFEESYKVLRKKNAELIAVPSFVSESNSWEKPFTPADESKDRHRPTTAQAWVDFVLPSLGNKYGFKKGVNVFLRGQFWEHGSDGYPILLHGGKPITIKEGAARDVIANMWL